MGLQESIKACRRAGVPLVGVSTCDPAGVVRACVGALNGKAEETPVVQWDLIRGPLGVNAAGGEWVTEAAQGQDPRIAMGNPAEFLTALAGFDAGGVVVMLGASRLLTDPQSALPVVQGVWNLRDVFKASGAVLVLVGPVGWALPVELRDDVVMCSDALPDDAAMAAMSDSLLADAGVAIPDGDKEKARIVDAVSGLSGFAAEQALALSLSKEGVDIPGLWERKAKAVEQTRGLSFVRSPEPLTEIGGLTQVKEDVTDTLNGSPRPRVVVWFDELEKALQGATGGDLSGTKSDLLGCLLTWWEDIRAAGYLLMGHPGSGKSAVAQAAGAAVGIPTLRFDLAGMQSGIVGSSGENMRAGLEVVRAIAGGESSKDKVLVIATCNGLASIPSELRRRFWLGEYFFDLPTGDELASIWSIWKDKTGRDSSEALPVCDGWTGAEVKACCLKASRQGVSLVKAAERIVPLCQREAASVEERRRVASGALLSASVPGPFRFVNKASASVGGGRKVNLN